MNRQKVLESFAERIVLAQELATSNNKASAARIVWFVAIAGYAFINIPVYLQFLLGEPLDGTMVMEISIPWALTALLGVIANWMMGHLINLDSRFFSSIMIHINSTIVMHEDRLTDQKVLEVINLENEEVRKDKKAVDDYVRWVTLVERLTFIFLGFSFIWSAVYPLLVIRIGN